MIGGSKKDRRKAREGLEEDWRRFGGGWVDRFSIEVRYIIDRFSMTWGRIGGFAGALGEDWRAGGGSEEGWRRIGGRLEKLWRRIGKGLEEDGSIDYR